MTSVIQTCVQAKTGGQFPPDVRRHVRAANFHVTEIHHHPAILSVALGNGDDFIGHLVVVGVGADVQRCEASLRDVLKPDVILDGVFRVQLDVPDVDIIQIVESGHPENALVERAEIQVESLEGADGEEKCGRKFPLVPHVGDAFENECPQDACLRLQSPPLERRRRRRQKSVSRGKDKVFQVRVQSIPLIIDGQVDVRIPRDGVFADKRGVGFPLTESIVEIHQSGVGVEIAHPIVGVLQVEHQFAAFGQPGTIPGQPGFASGTTGFVPGQPGFVPGQPGFASGTTGFGPGQPGFVPGQPGLGLGQPGMVPGQPGLGLGQPGFVPGQPGFSPGQPGFVSGQPGFVSGQPGMVPGSPGFGPGQPGLGSGSPGFVQWLTHPNCRKFKVNSCPFR